MSVAWSKIYRMARCSFMDYILLQSRILCSEVKVIVRVHVIKSSIYIYIYIYVCVCVCVRVRARACVKYLNPKYDLMHI